jgi:hypothetical protein
MKKLKRMLAAVTMVCIVSLGAFAQKKEEPKRPPKPADNKVIVKEKPPANNNQGNTKSDRKP